MPNSALLRTRLGQYGLAWLVAFLAVPAVALAAVFGLHMDQIRVLDLVLPAAFAALGAALAAFVVVTVMARQSAATSGRASRART